MAPTRAVSSGRRLKLLPLLTGKPLRINWILILKGNNMLNYFVDYVDTTGEDRLSVYQFSNKPGVMCSLGSNMVQVFKAQGCWVRKLVCIQGDFSKREINEMSKRWGTPNFPSSAAFLYQDRR
jgi:hypothetical protein